ncbi:MAG: DUF3822 family protein [Crocinitomicaceae bacterium]
MAITKDEAYRHVLCMDLQPDKLRFAALSKTDRSITDLQEIELTAFDRESIAALMTDEKLSFDYDGFVLTAGGKRNTLIPVDLFNHAKPAEVFSLNYPEPFDNLDYNRIPEVGIVNIYELPLWIKSLFVIKFPRVRIVHPVTVLLKGIFDQSIWPKKMHLYLEKEIFYLFITEKNKMIYFNQFDFNNLADMVYHLLFVLEQKEIPQDEIALHLYGVGKNWEPLDELQTFFAKPIQLDVKKEKGEHFILSQQLLCV